MKKLLYLCLFLCVLYLNATAQVKSFGVIDTADLKMTACDFEKDANAEVLFDDEEANTGYASTTLMVHIRVKIFNDNGKSAADIGIPYYRRDNLEKISDVTAETINLEGNTIKYVHVEPALIYDQVIDRKTKKISFTFPQVKSGSVIEYAYKLNINFGGGFANWQFQQDLPVKYCELRAFIRSDYQYNIIPRVYEPYTIKTHEPWLSRKQDTLGNKFVWALTNVNSYNDEPYSTGEKDNEQRIDFILSAKKFTIRGVMRALEESWAENGSDALKYEDFGLQLKEHLPGDTVTDHAKLLGSNGDKITYLFDYVKKTMKWNGKNQWYTVDGVRKAWAAKTGNSTEINMILYYFLKKAGVPCYPELVSTRDNGRIIKNHPDLDQFNKTVITSGQDNTGYVLDASNKYNSYLNLPFDVLNTTGFIINPDDRIFSLSLVGENTARKVVFVNGSITPQGELTGTAQINNYSYNKTANLTLYDRLGEKNYLERVKNGDNSLTIKSLKRDNMETDSLPLTETLDFKEDLTAADDGYIYLNPNLFTTFRTNPFTAEKRDYDIDFGCINKCAINGRYQVPAGYKVESIPKGVSMAMPDKSIIFKRMVDTAETAVIVHYEINFDSAVFTPDQYAAVHDFYKKMYELLNEQIVLKKI